MPIAQVPSPLTSILAAGLYNAEWFPGATAEAQIQNAINGAVTDGASGVYVPKSLMPYTVASVTFNSGIYMIHEGLEIMSADRGDADVTLTVGTDAQTQRFATTLTSNRTVTLGTGHLGAKYRIVRTGLGAFTLDVGGLKTIANSTAAFVDVEHDGTAWRLTGYGTL